MRKVRELADAQAAWAGGGDPDEYDDRIAEADSNKAALLEIVKLASNRAVKAATKKGETAEQRSLKRAERAWRKRAKAARQ